MANIGSGLITIDKSWTNLKLIVSSKKLSLQYDASSTAYDIFAVDGNIAYYTRIFIGSVPNTIDYNQAQNDADKSDFETNYKDITTNRTLGITGATDGYAISTAVPSVIAGSDGSFVRTIQTDSSGRLYVTGLGTAGTPVGGVVSIQGVASGTNVPVSGTVTANAGTGNFTVTQSTAANLNATIVGTATDNTTNSTAKLPVIVARANTSAPTWTDGNMAPLSVDTAGALRVTGTISATNASIGTNNSAAPSSSTQIGGSDGTNLQAARVFDLDTGVGSQYILGVGLRKSASGGSVELGTSTDPIRVDPTGTTTQPVSGTITANIGTTGGLALDTTLAKLTISQGTALGTNTQTLIGGSVTTAAPTYTTGNINPLSLTTSGALRVDGSATTQPISGTVTANAGTGNFTVTQATAGNLNATVVGSGNFTVVQSTASNLRAQTSSESATAASPPANATYVGGSVTTAAPTYTTGQINALSLTTSGLLRVDG